MKTILSLMTGLLSAGLAPEAGATFARIDRAANANVCNNDWLDGDVEGDFETVGDYEMGASRGGRSSGGRGGSGGGGGRSQGRGGSGHSSAMQRGGAPMGRGGPGGNSMLPAGAPNPPWLQKSNPYGISQPIEGLIQLPLAPLDNVGAMTATVTAIKFIGRVQRPFRGERVVATLTRSGATAATQTIRAINGIIVGVVPQQAQIGNTNLAEWASTAFGVRMAMNVAYPGVDITCNTQLLGAAPTAPDSITIDLTIYGKYVG